MKAGIVIAVTLMVVVLGWWLASPGDRPDRSYETYSTHTPHPPAATLTDATAVFQKAFWKHPAADDHILHAERREWQEKDGISKWQWFIAVKPSSALVAHLITDNAFMLTASRSGGRQPAEAPAWFPADAPQTFANATGTFRILWDKEKSLLHATDSGTGFRPGASESPKHAPVSAPVGRLSVTPLPKP